MTGDVELLLIRGDDLVVLGLRWVDMTPGPPAAPGGPAVLVADGPRPALLLTLPPQSTAEERFDPATGDRPQARLGGPSELRLAVAPGERVELSAAGVLERLRRHDGLEADLELPWGMHVAPAPRGAGDRLTVDAPIEPVASPDGGVGLWRARLGSAAGLALKPLEPLRPNDDSGGPVPPLDLAARSRIAAESGSTGILPTAPEVELTALGGSATVQATWPTYAWEHDVRLGRDMRVRVESKGVLYPFGHRAVLADLTERVLEPPDGFTALAGLRATSVLLVAEPVRRPADDGPQPAREFPFSEVQVLGGAFAVSPERKVPKRYSRPPKRLDALVAELDQQIRDRDTQEGVVVELLAAERAAVEQNTAATIAPLEAEAGELQRQVQELLDAEQAFLDFAAAHPFPPVDLTPPEMADEFGHVPSPPTEPPEPGPPRPDLTPVPDMQARIKMLDAMISAAQNDGARLLAALATEDGLPLVGAQDALDEVRRLRELVATSSAHLDAVQATAEQKLEVFVWPLAPDGQRLRLPVRCDDLVLSLPVLFVHDIALAEDDDFPAFVSLTSSEVHDDLAKAWAAGGSARVPLPGVRLDLVRSASPRDGDVHEVHELVLAGTPSRDSFRPQLTEVVVDLPAVRTLLPGRPSRAPVVFDRDFLERGDAADVALRLNPPLKVNFTAAADRSGGLVAPAYTADVLSRAQGLVDRAMLPGLPTGPPDLATVFAGAKLLGIPLARVIDGVPRPLPLDGVTRPLGLTPVLEGGRPVGARMAWDVKLKNHGPLRVGPQTTFRMVVEHAPPESRTTCRAEHFRLVLPPGTGDLVQLGFKALTFTQAAGRPPDLEVKGLAVTLGGDLGLLKTLQDAVDLASAAPVVRPTPTGISAAYMLAVPHVAAGAFTLRNIAVRVGVDVPFDGRPVVATLGYASRENPFTVSVLAFGGGGYLSFQIAEDGIRQLEASLDFGATVAIGVGVASAEVHALGGVRFELQGDAVRVTGFLRIGGSVDVLGLVSVSVELRVDLTYDGKALVGRATAVVEIDVTFWSGSVELDSGTFVLAGAMAAPAPAAPAITTTGAEPGLPDWQAYRNAFAPSQP
jgi:hypothetical protein